MRTKHTPHPLPAFPVYSSAFLSSNRLVLGGGGGTGRSGVKNKIRLYHIENDGKLKMLDELELQKDEDAPMSIAVQPERQEIVCGINSATERLEKGENENCRVYSVKGDKIKFSKACGTFQSSSVEDYQKVTAFSAAYNLLAVGATNNEITILSYPALRRAARPVRLQRGELYDATFSSTFLVVAATTHLEVFSLPKTSKSSKGKGKAQDVLDLVKTIDAPSAPVQGMTFRAVRFHPTKPDTLYTILNTSQPRTRGTKSTIRRAYICKWDTKTWSMVQIRKISEKGVTCFDISADGKLIGFGSSDYTIGILNSETFAPLLIILKAHDFPPTTLKFNQDASLLVSGSADNTVRVVVVPKSFENTWTIVIIICLTFLILLLSILYHQGFRV